MPRRRRTKRVGGFLVAMALAAGVTAVDAPTARVVSAGPGDQHFTTAGPLGPISVIGDSVLLGSMMWSPTIADELHVRGWGPVRMRSELGGNTGAFTGGNSAWKASSWVASWRQGGWDPVDVVVNLGANDSGICQADAQCAYEAIMHLVDAINASGPHRIWWAEITRFYTYIDQQNAWNAALDRVDAERSDFWTWDWPSEMKNGGYVSNDMTHLVDAVNYHKRSMAMARHITADLAFARHQGGDAPLPAATGGASEFVPLPPERVLDTRAGGGAPLAGGTHVDVDMTPFVPAGATAVAVNLTTDQTTEPGFLTGFPCDRALPEASNVNHAAAAPRGALAVVPLSSSGHLCVHTRATGHVIVDLQGAFVGDSPDGVRFTPYDTPQRLLDTRETGRASVIEVDVPDGAEAVAVNLTATSVTAPGWLKAYPCDANPPEVSNVNYLPGDTVASAAFVPVSPSGTICVTSLNPVDIVVDLTGVFTTGGGLRFVPANPTRLLDTRSGAGGWAPIQGASQTIDIRVVPPEAQAVTGTVTLVTPLRAGWLKAYPCGVEPPTSSVNARADIVLANAVTVGVNGDDRLCIKSLTASHTLFDVTGWWIP